jgi:hypothetical protein
MPITKHNYFVNRIEDLESALRNAFRIANSGRKGPVLIDITKDVTAAMIDYKKGEPMPLDKKPVACDEDVQKIADMINQAERPVVYFGGGVMASDAGEELNELAKEVAAEELIVTGELADMIGSEEATMIVNELKNILDQTQNMTDEEVKEEIRYIAEEYNVEISEKQIDQLLKLVRSLEGLSVDELKQKIQNVAGAMEKANKVSNTVTKITESVGNFFKSIGTFFKNLFS